MHEVHRRTICAEPPAPGVEDAGASAFRLMDGGWVILLHQMVSGGSTEDVFLFHLPGEEGVREYRFSENHGGMRVDRAHFTLIPELGLASILETDTPLPEEREHGPRWTYFWTMGGSGPALVPVMEGSALLACRGGWHFIERPGHPPGVLLPHAGTGDFPPEVIRGDCLLAAVAEESRWPIVLCNVAVCSDLVLMHAENEDPHENAFGGFDPEYPEDELPLTVFASFRVPDEIHEPVDLLILDGHSWSELLVAAGDHAMVIADFHDGGMVMIVMGCDGNLHHAPVVIF